MNGSAVSLTVKGHIVNVVRPLPKHPSATAVGNYEVQKLSGDLLRLGVMMMATS